VRGRRPTQQRVRLGPNRYRGSCGNSGPNANCFANTCVKRYAVRADNANAYTEQPTYYTYTHTYSYGNGDSASESNSYAKLAWVTYAYTYGDGHRYGPTESNTKASPDSASAAVKIG
jgi:hypothetical protein